MMGSKYNYFGCLYIISQLYLVKRKRVAQICWRSKLQISSRSKDNWDWLLPLESSRMKKLSGALLRQYLIDYLNTRKQQNSLDLFAEVNSPLCYSNLAYAIPLIPYHSHMSSRTDDFVIGVSIINHCKSLVFCELLPVLSDITGNNGRLITIPQEWLVGFLSMFSFL